MSRPPFDPDSRSPALEAFLLGQIAFDQALLLQQQIVEETRTRGDGQITLLLCEHPPIITVGRGGSPANVAMHNHLVRNRQLEIRWVNRGGGSLVHCSGQLAIYPIVPLGWHRFSLSQFLDRLQSGVLNSLRDLNVPASTTPPPDRTGQRDSRKSLRPLLVGREPGKNSPRRAPTEGWSGEGHGVRASFAAIYGRTGQLATFGIAVRHWITYYGVYLNVCPPTGLFRLIRSSPSDRAAMSCLVAERCGPVKMTAVRAALITRLAESFGCDRYHLYTGHPMLRRIG